VTLGAKSTVRVAGVLVAVPAALVATTMYEAPLSAEVVAAWYSSPKSRPEYSSRSSSIGSWARGLRWRLP